MYAHSHKQGIVKTPKQSSHLLVQAAAAAIALCNSTTRAAFGTSAHRFNLTIMILLLSSCSVAPEPCTSWQRMLLHWSSRSVEHLDSSDSPPQNRFYRTCTRAADVRDVDTAFLEVLDNLNILSLKILRVVVDILKRCLTGTYAAGPVASTLPDIVVMLAFLFILTACCLCGRV